jgi:hypothetical protein
MRRLLLALALTAGVALPLESAAFGATTTQVIQGKLVAPAGQSTLNYRVALVAPRGSSKLQRVNATGVFSFSVATSIVYGSSLQIIRPDGRYAGPVTLAKDALTSASAPAVKTAKLALAAHTQLAGVSVNLSAINLIFNNGKAIGGVVKTVASFGGPATKTTWYRKVAVRGYDATSTLAGALASATTMGLKRPTPFTAAEARLFTGAASALAPRAGSDQTVTGAGGDQDSDGIPNAFDVDDNGNQTLDAVDPNSSATAAANPWSDIRFDFTGGGAAFNAGLASPPSLTDVATAVGSDMGHYGLWFFLSEDTLKSAAGTSAALDWVRVDCGTLQYCGQNADGTAVPYSTSFGVIGEAQNAFSSQFGNGPVLWSDVNGGAYNCPSGTTDGQFTRGDANLNGTAPLNGMVLTCRNNGRGVEHVWNAMIKPQTGSATLSTYTPGDVFTIQYKVHNDATLHTYSMTLAPYFLTVPGLVTLNGSSSLPSNSGDTITPDSNGVLTMTFHRPQRAALAGETNSDGSAATFMDIGGLHYGFIIGAEGTEFGCGPTYYTGLSGLQTDAINSQGQNQWPTSDLMKSDRQVDAPSVSGAPATLTLRVDFSGCLAAMKVAFGHTVNMSNAYVSLTAAGEFLTGGANRSTLMFRLGTLSGSKYSGSIHY